MPRYNVEYSRLWACFSSVADGFVTQFMPKANYKEWQLYEYGKADCRPVEQCNMMTMKEAVFSVSLSRSRQEAIDVLTGAGLSGDDAVHLLNAYGKYGG